MTHAEPATGRLPALSEDTFQQILKEQFPRYVTYAKGITRTTDKAMDAVQNAMLAVLRGKARPSAPDKVQPFVQAAIRHAAYDLTDQGKRHRAKAQALADEPQAEEMDVGREMSATVAAGKAWCVALINPEDRRLVRRHFGSLTACQRRVLQLVLIEGSSVKAAGRALGIHSDTARAHLQAAVQAARRLEFGRPPRDGHFWERYQQCVAKAQFMLRAKVAWTDHQNNVLQALISEGGNMGAAAKKVGCHRSGVQRVVRVLTERLEARGAAAHGEAA